MRGVEDEVNMVGTPFCLDEVCGGCSCEMHPTALCMSHCSPVRDLLSASTGHATMSDTTHRALP